MCVPCLREAGLITLRRALWVSTSLVLALLCAAL
jgi:hypothetical protein